MWPVPSLCSTIGVLAWNQTSTKSGIAQNNARPKPEQSFVPAEGKKQHAEEILVECRAGNKCIQDQWYHSTCMGRTAEGKHMALNQQRFMCINI